MTMKIDKSVFSAKELAQYEALIAKAKVDTEANFEEMDLELPPERRKRRPEIDVDFEEEEEEEEVPMDKACGTRTRKSASPISAAMERLENLEKSIEMKEISEIAKKYAPLGEKEDELAQTLYAMKKSNKDNYDAYIAVLDKSLDLVEKSGLYAEIGKSTGSYGTAGGAAEKVQSVAQDIMKSDPSMTREQAILKAWEDHPELVAEYDMEYKGRA